MKWNLARALMKLKKTEDRRRQPEEGKGRCVHKLYDIEWLMALDRLL